MGGAPPGGVNQMVASDMAGRVGGGGDVAAEIEQHLQQAIMLTVQAGPEAMVMSGIGEVWKGAFATLKSMAGQSGPPAGPQGPGMPGAGPPPMQGGGGGMMPPAGPQMSGPMA